MLGDVEMVHAAQRDAPTMRRLSVEMQRGDGLSLRRLSTSSACSTTSSISQASSPTFSSSLPTHGFWPERMSSLFRTTSLPAPSEPSAPIAIPQRKVDGTPDMKMPALIRSLSKGMDSFR